MSTIRYCGVINKISYNQLAVITSENEKYLGLILHATLLIETTVRDSRKKCEQDTLWKLQEWLHNLPEVKSGAFVGGFIVDYSILKFDTYACADMPPWHERMDDHKNVYVDTSSG